MFQGDDELFTLFRILTGSSAIIGVYTFFKNEILSFLQLIAAFIPYIVGGFIGCSITILLVVILKKNRGQNTYSRMDYKILKAEYVYTFDDKDYRKQYQKISVKIKALKDGVSKYYARYSWTGKGTQITPKLVSPGQIIENVQIGSPWSTYEVHFKELEKDEMIDIQIAFEFYDAADTFLPLLYRNISEQIDNLSLRVVFSGNRLPKPNSPKKEVVDNIAPKPCIEERAMLPLDEFTHEVRWDTCNPKLNKIYRICWEWPSDD
jgi:hypothetical protein